MKKVALLGILSMSMTALASLSVQPVPQNFSAQSAQALPQSHSLPPSVATALQIANLSSDNIAIAIKPINGNAFLLAHNANTPFVPASTNKLITTAAALDSLGADFVWRTGVYAKGVLAGKVLYGDLIIKGSGDPSFSHEQLSLLLDKISKKINHIKGNIIIDNRAFYDVKYDVNAFDGQGTKAYNAYPSAFLLNYGTLEIKFTPSGTYQNDEFVPSDTLTAVSIHPNLGLTYPHQVSGTAGCGLPSVKKYGNALQILGNVGVGCGAQSTWLNVGDNESLAVQAVAFNWRQLDPAFKGKVTLASNEKLPNTPLLIHNSEPLSKQIWRINQFSNNVMTEQVALSLPLYVKGEKVSDYPKAFSYLNQWFSANIGKPVPTMSRASGLCYDCKVSPKAMTGLLSFMNRHKDYQTFVNSLPVAGQSGTMKVLSKRNPTHPAIGRAWLKTGTLNDVKALAGYVQGQSGQLYTFVAMINATGAGYNANSTRVLDELLAWTVEW